MADICGQATANGLPCALTSGHAGDHKRAAQVAIEKAPRKASA